MWHPTQRERREIGQDLTRSPVIEPSSASRAPKSRNDLEVDQLRCGELLAAKTLTDTIAIGAVIRKRGCEHRSVNDDHAAR